MRGRSRIVAALMLLGALLGGCANPDAGTRPAAETASPGGPGEPRAPAPTPTSADAPRGVRSTPQAALLAFATPYINWDYRTLGATQRSLAAIAVGGAHAAELQAAASSAGDPTITAGQIHNSGVVLSISPDREDRSAWVIVTRERTSGGQDYQGLPASDHVTIARVARVGGGYAVSEWLPQS